MEETETVQNGSQDQVDVGLKDKKADCGTAGCQSIVERPDSGDVEDQSRCNKETPDVEGRWSSRKHDNTWPGKGQVVDEPMDLQENLRGERWLTIPRPAVQEKSGCIHDCWQKCSHEDFRPMKADIGDCRLRSEPSGECRWMTSHRDSAQELQETPNSENRPQRLSGRTLQGGRVLRNRKYRRPFDDQRHTKRLFTPEIKKFLKDWLVRRRDHPYPNRDEKKRLAVETGLTYIQICNWFANWRRKLKNAGCEQRTTWGHLIKSYNTQAQGNVEQFSICSDDSIWEQNALCEPVDGDEEHEMPTLTFAASATAMDHCYSVVHNKIAETLVNVATHQDGSQCCVPASEDQPQCFQVTSTTTEEEDAHSYEGGGIPNLPQPSPRCRSSGTNKYKSHIMEKYMRDLQLGPSYGEIESPKKRTDLQHVNSHSDRNNGNVLMCDRIKELAPHGSTSVSINNSHSREKNIRHEKKRKHSKKVKQSCPPMVLSKWLESAAKFKPTKSYVPWTVSKKDTWRSSRSRNHSKNTIRLNVTVDEEPTPPERMAEQWVTQGHQKEELDAAEALTTLSGLQH